MNRAMAVIPTASSSAIAPERPAGGYPVPELPDDLRRQVDLLCGRHRFDDFVMTVEPAFHPDAARYAEQYRLAVEPASEGEIKRWFLIVSNSLAAGSVPAQAVYNALLLVGDDLPAPCWCRDTAKAIVSKETFLPGASELLKVLQSVAADLRADLLALDRIARADPATQRAFRTGPARASPVPYDPGAAMPRPEQCAEAQPECPAPLPGHTVEQQFAAFGYTPEQAAADLAATNARRWQRSAPVEPAKEPAEAPEFGGPGLHVVETDPASAPAPARPLPAMRPVGKPSLTRSRPRRA
jgi:hypothetical protein